MISTLAIRCNDYYCGYANIELLIAPLLMLFLIISYLLKDQIL